MLELRGEERLGVCELCLSKLLELLLKGRRGLAAVVAAAHAKQHAQLLLAESYAECAEEGEPLVHAPLETRLCERERRSGMWCTSTCTVSMCRGGLESQSARDRGVKRRCVGEEGSQRGTPRSAAKRRPGMALAEAKRAHLMLLVLDLLPRRALL